MAVELTQAQRDAIIAAVLEQDRYKYEYLCIDCGVEGTFVSWYTNWTQADLCPACGSYDAIIDMVEVVEYRRMPR